MRLTGSVLLMTLCLLGRNGVLSTEIEIAHAPYEATVEYKETANAPQEFKCSAVIYNQLWAITTASCVDKLKQNHILIRSGSKLLMQKGGLHVVKKIIKHNQFSDENTIAANIALIRLNEKLPFHFSETVANIPLAHEALESDVEGNIVGWSLESNSVQKGDKLQTLTSSSIDISACQKETQMDLTTGVLCSTGVQADEADPFVAKAQLYGLYLQTKGKANVYTDISYYNKWIHDTVYEN